MQSDGNLVLYNNEQQQQQQEAIWASNSNNKGTSPYRLILQTDGNLVIYDIHHIPIWATNTHLNTFPNYQLFCYDQGYIALL